VHTFVNNTIISGNRNAANGHNNVAGNIENVSAYNLFGSGGGADLSAAVLGPGNIPSDSPQLSPLGDHGGPTQTHAPLAGSPAIDAGDPAIAFDPTKFDQRGLGFARVRDVPGVNGLSPRIDIGAHEVGLARVVDVQLDSSLWTYAPLEISYAEIVPTGKQLAPIYMQNVNTIQVVFSEPVQTSQLTTANIKLYGYATSLAPHPFTISAGPNATTNTATLTFASPLVADKYRLELSTAITGSLGQALDGEWMNLSAPINSPLKTAETVSDDPVGRTFLSGDGTPGSTNNRFEFWFSVLPGDYNQDGLIRAADAVLGVYKDGNGDNNINSSDAQITTNALTSVTWSDNGGAASRAFGDYQDDEIVDLADYVIWKTHYGTNTADADGNGNGTVDMGDYALWRDNLTTRSAWFPVVTGAGGGGGSSIPLVDPLSFPRVANVTISGSNSTHAPFSFNGPDDNTDFDGSGIQLRTVPVGGADTISISFTEDVNITADTLKLTGLRTANRPSLAHFSYDIATMTATWRFTGWTFGDHYAITLSDAVTDVEGNALDGEWTNPQTRSTVNALVSEFPSGNGYAGGAFNFVATLLPGDANLNGLVDIADLSILQNHYQNGQLDELFSEADFNGDGLVNIGDLAMLSTNYGANLQNLSMLADLNGDWKVDDADLNILATNLGASNPTPAQGDLNDDNVINIQDLDLMFAQYGLELSIVA
jgi:hypothetical protein